MWIGRLFGRKADVGSAPLKRVSEIYTPASQPESRLSRAILGACDAAEVVSGSLKTSLYLTTLSLASPCLLLPKRASRLHDLYWQGLSNTVASMGPTAVKFLQWASTRKDIFPESFCNEVLRFQTRVPAARYPFMLLPLAAIARTEPLLVQPTPVGCGSVAQVHSVLMIRRLGKSSNKRLSEPLYVECVAKVLRPFVQERIIKDLRLMKWGAWALSRFSSDWREWFPVQKSVESFASMILPQTNLLQEAENLRRFESNFGTTRSRLLLQAAGGSVVIPKIEAAMASAEVLVESRESGMAFDRWLKVHGRIALPSVSSSGWGRLWQRRRLARPLVITRDLLGQRLARMGAHMFLQMLLFDNFVHSDLHPGNMLIRWKEREAIQPEDMLALFDKPKETRLRANCLQRLRHRLSLKKKPPILELVILDAGLTATLTDQDRANFIQLFTAVAFGEGYKAGRLILHRAKHQDCQDPDSFCEGVARIVEKYVGPPIRTIDLRSIGSRFTMRNLRIGEALQDILRTSMRYRVELDSAFVGVIIATTILEGVGRSLDPDIDLLAVARPFLQTILRHELEHTLAQGRPLP